MQNKLNILLFAFGHSGVLTLRALVSAGHRIEGCVTHPTTQAWLPSVQDECARLNIPCVIRPDDAALSPSMAHRPDVILSVGYRRKIQMPWLALARLGAFNVASSQLPRYRGYFPTRWAIINNETTWGVTVHQITSNYCDGAVLHRRSLILKPTENAYDLSLRVAEISCTAAIEAVTALASGNEHLESVEPSPTPFFTHAVPFDSRIDWNQPASKIESFIRAMDFGRANQGQYQHFTPAAHAEIAGHHLQIFRAKFGGTMSSYPPGTITRCDTEVWVQTLRGHLVIEKVIFENHDHDAPQLFASLNLKTGDRFSISHSWLATPSTKELSHAA